MVRKSSSCCRSYTKTSPEERSTFPGDIGDEISKRNSLHRRLSNTGDCELTIRGEPHGGGGERNSLYTDLGDCNSLWIKGLSEAAERLRE